MALMLRSKMWRILPQITRISSRSVYQNVQTNNITCRRSRSLVHVARALSTNALGSRQDYQTTEDNHGAIPALPRRHRIRSQMKEDLQTRLRNLDIQVQRTGRMTENRFMNVFDEVCRSGSVTPNQALLLIRSCGNLLAELSFDRRNQLVSKVWDKLSELGVRYDVTHYNALLWVHLQNEHVFSPTDFLSQMESKGIEPNRVTYQRLISIYCRQGDIQGATLILEVLKSKDLPVTEGVFNSLITGNARAGDMDSARNMLPVMRNMGLDPSLDTYTALACAYAEKGDIENINQVMQEAVSHDFVLTAPFYFKIVNSLTTNGHHEYVNQFLDQVELSSYVPDAINMSLNLWTQGFHDESFAVVKTFSSLPGGRSDLAASDENATSNCSFFIDHMLNSTPKLSSERIMFYLDEMKSLGLHASPYLKALRQILLDPGFESDVAISLMKTISEQGDLPIRPHFFWPLMAREKKKQNAQGVLDLLAVMSKMDAIDTVTFKEYVLPTLNGDVNSMTKQIQDAGIQVDLKLHAALCKHVLSERKPAAMVEVCKLYDDNPGLGKLKHIDRMIADNFIRDDRRKIGSLVKLLKNVCINTGKGQQSTVEEVIELDVEHDEDMPMYEGKYNNDPKERLGLFLYTLVNKIRIGEESNKMRSVLEKLFDGLADEGLQVSLNQVRGIRNIVHGRLKLKNLNRSLHRLLDPEDVLVDPVQNVDVLKPEQIDSCLDQLESRLAELTEQGEDSKYLMVKLIEHHAVQNNVEKVDELLKSYEEQGYEKTGVLYRELIFMRCRNGNLDEALKLRNELSLQREYVADTMVSKELITLLTKNNRMEEAIELIQEISTSKFTRPYVLEELVVGKVLDDLAEAGMVKEVKELLERCTDQGFVMVSRRLLQPLLAVHLNKNDLEGAINAVREANEVYKVYPNDHDLLVKIVASGDTKLLQQAMQNMGELMGEVNMIFSLAFGFLENRKYDEVEKLFKAPGISARSARMDWFANRCLENGMDEQLEKLVELSSHVYGCDRDMMYLHLLKLYGEKQNNADKCLEVYNKMQDEKVIPSQRTLKYLAKILQSHNKPLPFTIPVDEPAVEKRPHETKPRQEPVATQEKIRKQKPEIDPSLGCLEQVRLLLAHQQEYRTDVRKDIQDQVRRCTDDENLETFAALKQECEQMEGYTDTMGFRSQELRAHVNNGDLEGAHRIYSEMLQADKRPHQITVQKLGRKYAEAGQIDRLLDMKKEYESVVRSFGYPDNSSILGAYVKSNDISGAFGFINRMLADNKSVKELGLRHFFNTVVENNLPLDSVNEMVGNFAEKGETLPAKYLVYAHMQNGRTEEAKQLIETHKLQGCLLPYTIQLCRRITPPVDQIERVLQVSDVDGTDRAIVYRYVLGAYVKNRDCDGALRVRANMATENLTLRNLDLKQLAVLLREKQQAVPFDEPPESVSFYKQEFTEERMSEKLTTET